MEDKHVCEFRFDGLRGGSEMSWRGWTKVEERSFSSVLHGPCVLMQEV